MGKFDFTAFEAIHGEMKAEEQAQINEQNAQVDAQAASVAQPDPNLPIQPEPSQAVTQPSTQPQGFDIDAFLSGEQDVGGQLKEALSAQPSEEVFPGAEQAAAEFEPEEIPKLFADQEAMALLADLPDEIPTAAARPEIRTAGPGFMGTGVGMAQEETQQKALSSAQKIRDLGFTDEDIASALAFRRASLPPSKKFQQVAGTVAGIGIPAAINLIPGLAAAPEEIVTAPLVARTLAKLGLRAGGVGAAGAAGAIADVAADPDRDLTIESAFEAAKSGMIEEGAIEGIFGAGELGLARMFGRSGRMAAENVDELNELLAASAKRQGISQPLELSLGQASELPSAQTVGAIVESSLFGANPQAKTKALVRKSAVNLVKELPDTFAEGASKLSSRSVTNAVSDVLAGNRSFHTEAAQSMYGRAFELIDEAGAELVDVAKKVKRPAGKILSETGEPIVKAGVEEVVESVPRAGRLADLSSVKETGERLLGEFGEAQEFGFEGQVKNWVNKAANVDETTTVRGVQKMRSEALGLQRDLAASRDPNTSLKRVIDELVPVLDKTMNDAASAASGDAKRLLTRANKLWKANAKKFDNDVIVSIVGKAADSNPAAVFDIINSADEQQVKQLINGLTRERGGKKFINKAALDKIRGGYLAGMINTVSPEDAFKASGAGDAVGDLLLKKFNDMPPAVRNQLFKKSEQKDIINKFRLLSLSQKKGEAGLIGLKAAQALGAVGLAAAPFSKEQRKRLNVAGGVLVLGPSVLSSLLLRRPAFAKLLAQGFDVPQESKEGIKIAGRLARMVISERKRISKQREKVERASEIKRLEKKAIELGSLKAFLGE